MEQLGNMGSEKDLEKMEDNEEREPESESPTLCSEPEKAEKRAQHDSNSYPDSDHEETEGMDAGHQFDLEIQQETESIRTGRRKSADGSRIERTPTTGSTRSKLARITSKISTKSKKKEGLLREKIPETNLADGIVGWESQDDPLMPLNFPDKRKWTLLGLVSSITFISPLASSMFAPAVSFMDEEFHNSSTTLSALTVSIFVLGYVIGPLVLSPLSEIYGRRPILGYANLIFCVWQIGCALAPNISCLIAFRFLAGIGGSGCLTLGAGVIADLFRKEQRGLATSVYSLGPLFGPVIGPICGGFVAQRAGWRWIYWILLIAASLISIMIEIFNKETNPRVLIQRKTERLQTELNRPELRSCYDEANSAPRSKTTILRNGIIRPLKMLFLSPIVFIMSLYMAVVYGLLYLLFTTITSVFQSSYNWTPEICGLAYLPLGFGFVTGLIAVAKLSDATVIRMTKANNDVFEPEMRLPACIFFACFVPISFFWYGWAADYQVFWVVPILGLFPFGVGMMGIFIPIQTYMIDSFPMFAASAVAALTASRSLFGALLPLAAPSMYASLGLGWGNSVLGFIAIALIPAPGLIYRYGGKIRKEHPIRL